MVWFGRGWIKNNNIYFKIIGKKAWNFIKTSLSKHNLHSNNKYLKQNAYKYKYCMRWEIRIWLT